MAIKTTNRASQMLQPKPKKLTEHEVQRIRGFLAGYQENPAWKIISLNSHRLGTAELMTSIKKNTNRRVIAGNIAQIMTIVYDCGPRRVLDQFSKREFEELKRVIRVFYKYLTLEAFASDRIIIRNRKVSIEEIYKSVFALKD